MVAGILAVVLVALPVFFWVQTRRRDTPIPERLPPLARVPVPWVFILAYLAGLVVQHLIPVRARSPSAIIAARWAGFGLVLVGVALAFSALGLFRARRTTTIPFGTPAQLVRSGPYRVTRNPMYVGLTVLYVGVAGTRNELWPLAFLPLVLLYLERLVIPMEERRLSAIFGASYDEYRTQVRRWI